MKTKASIFGHPVHQMLIPIPLGLFVTASVIDLVSYLAGSQPLAVVSFWNLVIGIGVALVAAIFGLVDWTGIPSRTRAKRVGAVHGIGNVVMVGLFVFVVGLRAGEPGLAIGLAPLLVEMVALALGVFTGWLGGELVDRYAIGVHSGANPDAPGAFRRGAPAHPRRPQPSV